MRVVILTDYAYVNGGASRIALDSAKALSAEGHEVVLFAAVGPVSQELLDQGIEAVCTNQHDILGDPNRLRAVVSGLWNRTAALAMKRLLARLNPKDTVVHVHSWTKALSASPVRVALDAGFPVVCTLHDYFTACPNGGFFNFQTNNPCDLVPMSFECMATHCDVRNYPQKVWRVSRTAVQNGPGRLPRGVSHFIAVSDFSAAILRPYLPGDGRLYRVDSPINVARHEPVAVDKNRAFVFIGRLSKEKGPYLFAEAAMAAGVDAVFVGDGPELHCLRERYPDFTYTGWLDPTGVNAVLKSARALVLPSVAYETFGLVVLEAAAMGVPAIVPDASAPRDTVQPERTGLWFQRGNAVDLARQIARVAGQDDLAERLGSAAYEDYWRRPVDSARHVRDLLGVYSEALGNRRNEMRGET